AVLKPRAKASPRGGAAQRSDSRSRSQTWRVFRRLSLTPALCRWERENLRPVLEITSVGDGRMRVGKIPTCDGCSLSQRERARVRENRWPFNPHAVFQIPWPYGFQRRTFSQSIH